MVMRMSINPLFGNKKRSSSMLYDAGQAPLTTSSVFQASSSRGGRHGDCFQPNKRYKTAESTKTAVMGDPFGENEDFTVDDLEEIDILATQALTQEVQVVDVPSKTLQPYQVKTRLTPSSTRLKTRSSTSWNTHSNAEGVLKDSIGNGTDSVKGSDNFGLHVLQAQHEELKKKLKEVQDDILAKNGEIKVLRDSLRQSEHGQEQQRTTYLLLEKEKAKAQSEKDKEFSKKLQSLQSELHFKDAEMNEMKTRLQNCERMSKSAAATSPYISPKKSSPANVKSENCSISQNGKHSFPTKESFSAEMSPNTPASVGHQINRNLFNTDEGKVQFPETKQKTHEPISYTCVQRQNTQGSILLNALMKQPIAPGSLGLYHLLSSSPEPLPGVVLQPNIFSSFQGYLLSPVMLRCLCPEAPLSSAHLTVRLLAVFAEHQQFAAQLCSCTETCVLLALYTYVTSRPDKQACEKLWLLLEEEIVRFQTKLCVQPLRLHDTYGYSTCQCTREVVKALVIMVHRQWLKVRRSENSLCGFQKRAVTFLRDALLLLHTLSQKDKSFNEHCIEVLHQYDQAMPGIRAIFRKLPDLKESEELALEDLCPPEPEMDDQDIDCD
ncbi:ATR-interacting protein isoform X3 [Ambystoma mexicanum]|uniref:ATR-interacting protein isoform X3 n=1 Tax=Ambystoma mexicanum TaxID=8296 RepID=UPI0037E9009B